MSLCPNPFSVMAFYLYEQLCLVHYAVINIVLACGEKCVCKSGKLGLSIVFMVLYRSNSVSNVYKYFVKRVKSKFDTNIFDAKMIFALHAQRMKKVIKH